MCDEFIILSKGHVKHLFVAIQAEFYLVEYVNALAAVPGCLVSALAFLAWCPLQGRELSRQLVYQLGGSLDPMEERYLEAHCLRVGLKDLLDFVWELQGRHHLQVSIVPDTSENP